MIFPNLSFYPTNFNAPYSEVYNQMKEMINKLLESRIIIKKLVYIIGLSPDVIKNESKLKSFEYFGQYGKINKLVVNKNKIYNSNGPNGPSYTCFITYSSEAESSLAILSLDNSVIDSHEIKANYGTTKYCINFLKNSECKNKDCIYFHYIADKKDVVSREQMNNDKDIFHQQRLMAIELSGILTKNKYRELYNSRNKKTIFPNSFSVYTKYLVIQYIKNKNLGISLNLNASELTIIKKTETKADDKNSITNNQINIKQENENEKPEISVLIKQFIENKKSLNYLYKSSTHSRFNFANQENVNNELNSIIPSQLNEFVTQLFVKHSIFYNQEQNNLSLYYFGLKPSSLDSNDSWSSLISTLKRWNDINDVQEIDMAGKFNTY